MNRIKCPICHKWVWDSPLEYWKKGEDSLCGCLGCKIQSLNYSGRKCPMCHKKQLRYKTWLDGKKLLYGCVYCYLNYVKEKKGLDKANDDPDDIL